MKKLIQKQIASNLRKLRKESGLTQGELAKKIGSNVVAISKLERGVVVGATEKRLERIAEALGVPTSDIYAGISIEGFTPTEAATGGITTAESAMIEKYRHLPDSVRRAVQTIIESATAAQYLDQEEVELIMQYRQLDEKSKNVIKLLSAHP